MGSAMGELTRAQQAFAEQHQPLIYAFMRRNGLNFEEWYDIISIGLLKAVLAYPHDQCDFDVFAYWRMKNEWYMEHRREERTLLTYKEDSMEKKRFVWGATKKARLSELYAAGASIADLAAEFDIGEDIIYKAIDKFGFERNLPTAPELPNSEPITALVPLPAGRIHLEQSKALIHNAMVRNMCIVALLRASPEDIVRDLAYELGKQYMYLSEAESTLTQLLGTQEP